MSTALARGEVSLGIELGSTRIKTCLIDDATAEVLATGGFEWENSFVDGVWTYDLAEVWRGVAAAYAELAEAVSRRFGEPLSRVGAIGVSAMMHGYLAFDSAGELLVPFRTWRNTNTAEAARQLGELFAQNIPLRWSVAHLYQAVLDREPHLPQLDFFTTLAGYVHWRLTEQRVLGIGDAVGMFPITGSDYDETCLTAFAALAGDALPAAPRDLLPRVLVAGEQAGTLTPAGAALLDPSGVLQPGVPLCPPEGDAGTGMVATGTVAPRSGNVSVGTSVFAMVVLERGIQGIHHEIDLVTTPAGDPVAMVHCNNGASEFAAWTGLFTQFAAAIGSPIDSDTAYAALYGAARAGAPDAGGLLAYNHLAGEPIAGLSEGRPLVVRQPGSAFTLENFMRAQLYGVFGTLSLGMEVLASERVAIDRIHAHGGVFRTAGVAQQALADALNAPVAVSETASEGGSWGIAVLASYLRVAPERSLQDYLDHHVFADSIALAVDPDPAGVAGFRSYLTNYRAGLAVERAALAALPAR